jgi:hypothetical protein
MEEIMEPTEKIWVKITESDSLIEAVVYNKKRDRIQIVLGSGTHALKVTMFPNKLETAYVANAGGRREMVYERSCDEVQKDIDRLNPELKRFRR